VALGACNQTGDIVFARIITTQNNGFTVGPWNTMGAFEGFRVWINISTWGPDKCGIIPCPHPAAYRVQGFGTNMHLRSAEEIFDGSCVH
jgi:hypothetical protein